jgi:hypothetical protein
MAKIVSEHTEIINTPVRYRTGPQTVDRGRGEEAHTHIRDKVQVKAAISKVFAEMNRGARNGTHCVF